MWRPTDGTRLVFLLFIHICRTNIFVEHWSYLHKKGIAFSCKHASNVCKANSFGNVYKALLFLASTPMPRRVSPFSITDNKWGMNPARESFSYWALKCQMDTYTFSYSLYNNLMHLTNPGCI